jgi:hypothetical protein
MDLALYARVLWRFKVVVVLGFVLAAALATLSMVRITSEGVEYRDSELWASTTRLGVTQNGFPWGRLLATIDFGEAGDGPVKGAGIPLANPNRLNELAVLYSELARSDPVRRKMLEAGPVEGEIATSPVLGGDGRVMLPLIDLTAIATSPRAAVVLADRAASAVNTYIREQQIANKVPSADRVVLEQLERPSRPELYQGRPKTLAIVVFLAVLFASVGLAFLLENARPRPPEAFTEPELQRSQQDLQGTARRTA